MGSSLAESERTDAVPRVSAARTRQLGLENLKIRSTEVFNNIDPEQTWQGIWSYWQKARSMF
jgi:hypothetical protein